MLWWTKEGVKTSACVFNMRGANNLQKGFGRLGRAWRTEPCAGSRAGAAVNRAPCVCSQTPKCVTKLKETVPPAFVCSYVVG